MLKVAKNYNTNLVAVKISTRLHKELPAWYHLDKKLSTLNSKTARCLIEKHRVSTVTDLVNVSARVRNRHYTNTHRPYTFCLCRDCLSDQEKGCEDPHKCAEEALSKLRKISPKLNLLGAGMPPDCLSLTPRQMDINLREKLSNGKIIFDPSVTCNQSLADVFCIFVNPNLLSTQPALHHP